jgi:hypothetical protein
VDAVVLQERAFAERLQRRKRIEERDPLALAEPAEALLHVGLGWIRADL